MTELPPDDQTRVLVEVTTRLERARIPYMLSGSLAFSLYARPRMTRDIDLVVDAAGDHDALVRLFEGDFYIEAASVLRAVAERRLFNAIHLATLVKVDVVVRKDDAYRRTEFARRRRIIVGGHPLWVVTAEDLLLSKLVWWRRSASAVQWEDVRELVRLALDWGYVERWAGELGVADALQEARA